MNTSPTLLFSGFVMLLLGCSPDDENPTSPFVSKYTFEIGAQVFARTEDGKSTEAIFNISKARLYTENDSARVITMSGLGDQYSSELTHHNTLFISFIEDFSGGFNMQEDQFTNWVDIGRHEFTPNGNLQGGVGVIWYDEQGEMWVSGNNIGEDLTGNNSAEIDDYQNDGQFNIFSATNVNSTPGGYWTREVTLTFTCTLYHANGNSLKLNNASFQTLLHLTRD